MRAIYLELEIIYLIKGNSPINKAKIVQSWLKETKDFIIIYWPELSLNLNIIENILKLVINDCDVMKKRNRHKSKQNINDHVKIT